MTGRGIVLALTFLLTLFWALVTGSREVWLAALLTGALLLAALVEVLPAALCLRGRPRLSAGQVTRGGMAAYVIDWSGRLLLPVYVRVTVTDPCAADFRGLDLSAGRICAQRFVRPWGGCRADADPGEHEAPRGMDGFSGKGQGAGCFRFLFPAAALRRGQGGVAADNDRLSTAARAFRRALRLVGEHRIQ